MAFCSVINKSHEGRLGIDWVFMRFDPKGNDGAGQYAVINTFDENATSAVEFALPPDNVRPGFLIAHVLKQGGTSEDLHNVSHARMHSSCDAAAGRYGAFTRRQ